MRRRSFVKALALAPLPMTSASRLFAAPAAPAKLLVVFLRGGYDAANVVIPISSRFYYESRPHIAVPRPSVDANSALALDADWGLHPVLRGTLLPLFQKQQLAFVPFAGTHDLSRSHFETQDSIELGQPPDGRRDFQSGFLNRLAAVLESHQAISFTDRLPLILQGEAQIPNIALQSLGRAGIDARQSAIIEAMYKNDRLAPQVSEGFVVRDEVMQDMAGEMAAASRDAITAKGFELQARRVGKLMGERFNIGFIDVGGWDTHVGEGGANGYLAGRLEELGRGLAAFAEMMGPSWSDTVVVVISEFGRTFRENGNRGTDHGHGTVYWVLGGSVRGGRMAGEQIRLERATLFQDRDYPVLNEYRALLAGLLERMYQLGPDRLERVFPRTRPRDIGLI